MTDQTDRNEAPVDKKVTFHIEVNGRLFAIENIPGRVNVETGENHSSPESVERLQTIVRERLSPLRTIQTLVYEFA